MVEREVVSVEGRDVWHGAFKSWYSTGQLEQEGDYKDGWRAGAWKHYHANGQLAGEGAYRAGLRNSRWRYWLEDGSVDGERQGTFRAEIENYPSGARRIGGENKGKHRDGTWSYYAPDGVLLARGEYRRHRRSGTWSFYWPGDGELRYRGEYLRDERTGVWAFHLPGGGLDPELQSGVYEKDSRKGTHPEHQVPAIDLASLPELSRAPEHDELMIEKIDRAVARFADSKDVASTKEILKNGRAAMPSILSRMATLELGQDAQVELGFRLNYELLAKMHKGHAYDWAPGTSEGDARSNALTIARWWALWESTRDRADFVDALEETPIGSEAGAPFFELPFDPFLEPVVTATPVSPEGVTGADPKVRKRAISKYGGRGTEEALEAALSWLVAHQSENGSWSPQSYSIACASAGAEPFCQGAGLQGHAVGVTSLAVLALLGSGSGPASGEHAPAIQKAVDWLLAEQRGKDGMYGEKKSLEHIYSHGLATMALGKALRSGGSPVLKDSLERARDYILSQQLKPGGWRYDTFSSATPDSSVTTWMIHALLEVRRCGLNVDESVLERAMGWLDVVTNPETLRVGYDDPRGGSARVPNANEDYSRDIETLTAAAVYARMDAGKTLRDSPAMKAQLALIQDHLPVWGDKTVDLYGWYHGTYAKFHQGGKDWKAWNTAQKRALLEGQVSDRKSHEYGSFPTQSVWGHAGGRVYTTAMAALILEVYFEGEPLLN